MKSDAKSRMNGLVSIKKVSSLSFYQYASMRAAAAAAAVGM